MKFLFEEREKKTLPVVKKKAVSRFVVIFGAISLFRSARGAKNRNEDQIDDVQLKLIIV